jgi:hypothetical protein
VAAIEAEYDGTQMALVIRSRPDVTPRQLRAWLRKLYGFRITVAARLAAPLPSMLRLWAERTSPAALVTMRSLLDPPGGRW